MKKNLNKKEQAIREAFQIYDSAKVRSVKKQIEEERDGIIATREKAKGTDQYVGSFEENMVEQKIYQMIEKLPIENPRKKARRIWIGSISIVILCVLVGCLAYYVKEKPARITKVLQEIYLQSGQRMEKGVLQPLVTEDGFVYSCHSLTKKEQQMLEKRGVVYKKEEKKVSWDYSEDNVQLYQISERESRQFILVKDGSNQTSLGKFIGYDYWRGLAVTADGSNDMQEKEGYGTKEILENILGIHSMEDIRSVTLERSQALSKNNPEKLVAMWTNKEGRGWFYDFFSKACRIWTPSPIGEETVEKVEEIKEEGFPITFDKSQRTWSSLVLKDTSKNTFYLGIENKLHETLVLGVMLENDKVELWIEPMEEWMYCDYELGESTSCFSDKAGKNNVQAEKRNGVICLSKEDQKRLSEVIQKALDTE